MKRKVNKQEPSKKTTPKSIEEIAEQTISDKELEKVTGGYWDSGWGGGWSGGGGGEVFSYHF